MKPDDITVQILIEIRDEIRSNSQRIDQTNLRLDQTNLRIDMARDELGARIDGLGQRVVESELRTATAIDELGSTMRDVHGLLKDRLDLRDRVDRCERDIEDLKRRVG